MSYPLIGGHYFLILFFLVLLSFLYLFDLCGKGMKKSNCDEVISILLCSLYRDVMQECFVLAMFLNNSVLFIYSRPCTRPQSSLSPYILTEVSELHVSHIGFHLFKNYFLTSCFLFLYAFKLLRLTMGGYIPLNQ